MNNCTVPKRLALRMNASENKFCNCIAHKVKPPYTCSKDKTLFLKEFHSYNMGIFFYQKSPLIWLYLPNLRICQQSHQKLHQNHLSCFNWLKKIGISYWYSSFVLNSLVSRVRAHHSSFFDITLSALGRKLWGKMARLERRRAFFMMPSVPCLKSQASRRINTASS